MARASEMPMNRVHRLHLSPEHEALRTQYQPTSSCKYCVKVLKVNPPVHTEWLMEPPKDGAPLEFYCTHCGRYQVVLRAA